MDEALSQSDKDSDCGSMPDLELKPESGSNQHEQPQPKSEKKSKSQQPPSPPESEKPKSQLQPGSEKPKPQLQLSQEQGSESEAKLVPELGQGSESEAKLVPELGQGSESEAKLVPELGQGSESEAKLVPELGQGSESDEELEQASESDEELEQAYYESDSEMEQASESDSELEKASESLAKLLQASESDELEKASESLAKLQQASESDELEKASESLAKLLQASESDELEQASKSYVEQEQESGSDAELQSERDEKSEYSTVEDDSDFDSGSDEEIKAACKKDSTEKKDGSKKEVFVLGRGDDKELEALITSARLPNDRKGKKPNVLQSLKDLRERSSQYTEDIFTSKYMKEPLTHVNSPVLLLRSMSLDPELVSSKKPLASLNRISLQELRIAERVAAGYLLLRTLEDPKPCDTQGVSTIVEDHLGNVVFMSIYYLTADSNAVFSKILPSGTVFLLKEPYITEYDAGEPVLRCESPTNMIVLYKENVRLKLETKNVQWKNNPTGKNVFDDPVWRRPKPDTPLMWKKRGDELRAQSDQLEHATRSYLLFQKYHKNERETELRKSVRLSLANVYFERGYWDNALTCAMEILKDDKRNIEALKVAGNSCYELRKFDEANEHFGLLYDLEKTSAAKNDYMRGNQRVANTKGKYDMFELFKTRDKTPRSSIPGADYIGPVRLEGKDRRTWGMVAAKDIEPGTLLAVSKALAFSFIHVPPKTKKARKGQKYKTGTIQNLIAGVVQLILKNPLTYGTMIYNLKNARCGAPRPRSPVYCDSQTKEEPVVNTEEIKAIVLTCLFGDFEAATPVIDALKNDLICRSGFGLFTTTSFYHSCINNASVHAFNDLVFIRAIQKIKAGEKIFVPDVSWDICTYVFQHPLRMRSGVACPCQICLVDSQLDDDVITLRSNCMDEMLDIYDTLEGVVQNDIPGVIIDMKRIIGDYESTYEQSDTFVLRPQLATMYAMLAAQGYKLLNNKSLWKPREEMACLRRNLSYLGFDLDVLDNYKGNSDDMLIGPNAWLNYSAMAAIRHLAALHANMNNIEEKNRWISLLTVLENVNSGGNLDCVKHIYAVK